MTYQLNIDRVQMYLSSLSLKNFRNYNNQTIDFHSTFNFIFGKNAQGKTNLLEAIYFLGHLKSFRTSAFEELISKESTESTKSTKIGSAVIESSFVREELDHQVRIVLEDGKKGVWLNQKRPSLYQDYYGLIPVILFEPWEVYLFRESPSMRRKFLDRAVFLDTSSFLKIAREFETVVAQKNRLLKDLRDSRRDDEAQLEVWNEKLASLGSEVVFCRLRWMEKVNRFLSDEYRLISKGTEEMKLSYVSTCSWKNFEKNGDKADIYRELVQKIEEKKIEEQRRCESLVGPHRDDWLATLGNRPLGTMGSQGENRCGIIAIKSIQVKIYREDKGFPPLFILDDVGSELDASRSEALFHTLLESAGQVFLTTTETSKISNNINSQGLSFLVEEGKIRVLG